MLRSGKAGLMMLAAGLSASLGNATLLSRSGNAVRSSVSRGRLWEGWGLQNIPYRPKGPKIRPHGARKADIRAAAKRRRVKAHRVRSRG